MSLSSSFSNISKEYKMCICMQNTKQHILVEFQQVCVEYFNVKIPAVFVKIHQCGSFLNVCAWEWAYSKAHRGTHASDEVDGKIFDYFSNNNSICQFKKTISELEQMSGGASNSGTKRSRHRRW